jgi:uncharacterized protein
MKVSFLGGAYEVGGSCILLSIDNKKILFDCGIRQSAGKDPLPDFSIIQALGGLDAIVISHAHLDHTGSLPLISREYPLARIYMTRMTKDLIRVLLYDSIKIMSSRECEIPLYAEKDVEDMLNRVYPLNFEADTHIFDNIKLTFYNAGHIAGAACTYIQGTEGAVFYSGDFSVFSQKTVEGAKIPRLRPDAAIFESTYGDKLHSNRDNEEERLIELAGECISKNGKMLIPAFALGRAQEVLLILKKAINKGKLKDAQIYCDGMIRNINTVYKSNPLYLKGSLGKKILKGTEPFYDDNVKAVGTKEERDKILKSDKPVIIVSSSGMLTGGPSQTYAEKIAVLENGYIVLTGYQDEESPGRKLLNLLAEKPEDRILELNEKKIPVRCRIEQIGLSAHSDKGEIKSLVSHICHSNIFLVHGEENAMQSLSRELAKDVRGRIYTPKCGETVDIYIRNKREQWRKQIPHVMFKKDEIEEENLKELGTFIWKNYGDRLFTAEEILFIWKGSSKLRSSEADKLQKVILDSPYFENDTRRLFLFKARNEEAVEEALRPAELKQNEINDLAKAYFEEYSYKKISLILEEKKVILNFDFPKAIERTIYKRAKEFEDRTNWKIAINEQTNINAVNALIKSMLDKGEVKKISYYLGEDTVMVALADAEGLDAEIKDIKKVTGLNIKVSGTVSKTEDNTGNDYYRSDSENKLEQNEVLKLVEDAFLTEEFKPYRKSIKTLGENKYIELAFIAPIIGRRFGYKLAELASITGWDMSIGNSINQNDIIALASSLCSECGIKLKKNPSFNPTNMNVTLKIEGNNGEALDSIKNDFEYRTGCKLVY